MAFVQESFSATGPGDGGAGFAAQGPVNGLKMGVYGESGPRNAPVDDPNWIGVSLEERGIGVTGVSGGFDDEGGVATADGIGVWGLSRKGVGVVGLSTNIQAAAGGPTGGPIGNGMRDRAGGVGVRGVSAGVGVHGFAVAEGEALERDLAAGIGVVGSGDAAGVSGVGGPVGVRGNGGIGVSGVSYVGDPGVVGTSLDSDLGGNPDDPASATGSGDGVAGGSGTGSGVSGQSVSGVGVTGISQEGRGGQFGGALAAVTLTPSPTAGHPAQGDIGDLVVDNGGSLFFCKGGANWVQLA